MIVTQQKKTWKSFPLGEITTEVKPGYPSGQHNSVGEGYLHFRPYNIDVNGTVDISTNKYVPLKSENYFLRENDIVFNNTNSPELLGKTCLIKNPQKWVFSNHMTRIRLKENVYPPFCAIYLHYLFYKGFYRAHCSNHVNQASISSSFLSKHVNVPLPTIEIQQRIVDKIEELSTELDKSIEQLKLAQQQLKTYRQSVLNLSIPDYEYVTLESVIDRLDQGWSPKCENESSNNGNEWAVIKTSAVQHGYFVESENKRLPAELHPRAQHELIAGDILITRAGPRVRVGVCCLIKTTRSKLINSDKVYRIRANEKVILPRFLEFLLNTPKYLDEIEKMKSGINDSGVNLTQKAFLQMQIPVPPLQEQEQILQLVENRLSVADKMEEGITQSLQQAEALRQSILKKAFEGKLV